MQFFSPKEPDSPVICIAICNFIPPSSSLSIPSTSKASNFLPFYVGERLQIISHCDNWCFGHFEADSTQTGIFPSNFIEPIDENLLNDEDDVRRFSSSTFDSVKESKQLLLEITETLKAWWKFLKKDYSRGLLDSDFQQYEDSIKELILTRKRILSGNIPTEELKELRHTTAKKIDLGSHRMGLSMPIRDEASRILRIDNLSVISSYREHEKAYSKIISDNFNEIPQLSILFINLNQIDFNFLYDCELTILLWDNDSKKALTESMIFKWDRKLKKFNHQSLSGMFVGLNVAELMKESFELTATITVSAPIDIALSALNGKPAKIIGDPICVRQPLAQGSLKLADKLKDILDKEKRELRLSFKPLMQIEKFKSNRKSELFIEFTIQRLTGPSIEEIEIRHPEIFNPKPISILRLNPTTAKEIMEENRNEIYLKLGGSDFHGGKYSDKNIEVYFKVYDDEGNPKSGCFVTTTPDKIEYKDFYRSCVYCSEDRPIFNEMIKISLPSILTKDLHLRILYYHRRTSDKSEKDKSVKPFAVSWLRLIYKGVLEKSTSDEL
uniref:SH3 domain-containing protein n=1 Tax=Panagrolaimus sp. ES5 TaxID=591445 RepID=A0AC34FV59_9BILA